ncbi:MAG: SAM-dependent chlorinase/fluorinase [Anaerolineae bacterium]|nr:SAM-dependent chlorinase/fluorinase [Anaerolineae bacterium]
MSQRPLVTLTTDFGTADGYAGAVKGVILGIAPEAHIVDITHEIAPHNIRQAAFVLHNVYPYFPPHTVHMVVVDPGVGSARRPIALRTLAGSFVGPDNGVFSFVMARERIEELVELANPRYRLPQTSYTFHGRDIFAPAAAHLALGVPLATLGPPVHDPCRLPWPRLEVSRGTVVGEVVHIDRFGNLVTSIGFLLWHGEVLEWRPAFGKAEGMRFRASGVRVRVEGVEISGVSHTYAEVEPGQWLALVGSSGYLEIAIREGNAAHTLGVSEGAEVLLQTDQGL